MRRTSDELDYELIGDDLQAVIVTLDPGETVIAEAGAMMFMEHGIEMNTTLDPNKQGGGMLGKLFAGAKRVLSGDTFFVTTFANAMGARKRVAFSSHFPGKITPVDLTEWGGVIIAQKDSFLCAPKGTPVDIAFTKRIGAGFFWRRGIHSPTHQWRRRRGVARVGSAVGDDTTGGRDAARGHRLHRRDERRGAVRHPDGAGDQDGALWR